MLWIFDLENNKTVAQPFVKCYSKFRVAFSGSHTGIFNQKKNIKR